MKRYALVNLKTSEVLRHDVEANINPDVPTKSGFKWLEIIGDSLPKYNEKTQTPQGPFYKIEGDKLIQSYTIFDKPKEEIRKQKKARIRNSGSVHIMGMILKLYNEIQELKGLPKVTREEFLEAITDDIEE